MVVLLPLKSFLKLYGKQYTSGTFRFQFMIASSNNNSFQYLSKRNFSKAQSKKDYYEVLGVSKTATKDEIKRKFREKAKQFHPDLNKDDKTAESKFSEVSEAYEVLEDDKKRQLYDSYGHSGVDQNFNEQYHTEGFNNPFSGFLSNFHSSGPLDAEDVMEMFFGASMNSRPVEVQVKLSFFEAVNGCRKDISFEYFTKDARTRKKVRHSKKVTIDIPAGVDDGMSLRSPGNGRDGVSNQSAAGDLVISFSVTADPYFERNGDDVVVNVPISFTQAILGSSVDVLTIGRWLAFPQFI
jgi:DnaJ-class molecular chaperone